MSAIPPDQLAKMEPLVDQMYAQKSRRAAASTAQAKLKQLVSDQADTERGQLRPPPRAPEPVLSVPAPGSMKKDYTKGIAGAPRSAPWYPSGNDRLYGDWLR